MALIVAFAVTVAIAPVAAVAARRWGIVDHPGPLKVHARPVPYLGGVAVFAGLLGPVVGTRAVLLAPLALALGLGLADDVADLPPALRLGAEVAIGATTALIVPVRGPLGALLTVAFVVVLINAVNLLDGLDGLACGVGAVSAVGFAIVLDGEYRVLALALAGALGGLLVWNRPPARIYLGDAGSYLIGTALAVLLAAAFGAGEPVALASGALLLVAVPVADTAIAIVRRFRARRPLLQGDRGHVYDQLVDRGWTPGAATGACIIAQALLATCGVALSGQSPSVAVAVTATVVVAVGGIMLATFTAQEAGT